MLKHESKIILSKKISCFGGWRKKRAECVDILKNSRQHTFLYPVNRNSKIVLGPSVSCFGGWRKKRAECVDILKNSRQHTFLIPFNRLDRIRLDSFPIFEHSCEVELSIFITRFGGWRKKRAECVDILKNSRQHTFLYPFKRLDRIHLDSFPI